MALSDEQVEKQINHMKRFIEQEAQEKAEEIMIKAEEEFNIEKGRLLQNEKRKLANFFERKEKQLELQRKIQHSNMLNQSRLAVLKTRDDSVKQIVEETRLRLGKITEDAPKYRKMLEDLIAQGLFQLLEKEVLVRCRQQDVDIVKNVLPNAVKLLETASKIKTAVKVDEKNFLPVDCSGGVLLLAMDGKITLINTLESRLELLAAQMMPEIRTVLFGINPSRHFMD